MRLVKTVAVTNQKGGVGKTTTVVNLGAALAARGHDVCLIDLDAQSQLTLHLGIDVSPGRKTIYDVLTRGADLSSATVDLTEHLSVVPSEADLAAAEMEIVGRVGREQILSDSLTAGPLPYEFVLIDCPPSLGLLTLNALAAADELLIPLQAHFFGLQGLGRLFETVSLVRQRINPRLRIRGVVLCMFERQTRLAGEVVSDLTEFLASARGTDAPWADAQVFRSVIRRNVKLAECPSYAKTIFDYEPKSHGAEDYSALADEFLACFAPPPAAAPSRTPPVEADSAPIERVTADIVDRPAAPREPERHTAPIPTDLPAAPVAPPEQIAPGEPAAPAPPPGAAAPAPAEASDETYRPVPPRPTDDMVPLPAAAEPPPAAVPADEAPAAEAPTHEAPSPHVPSRPEPASAPSEVWPPK